MSEEWKNGSVLIVHLTLYRKRLMPTLNLFGGEKGGVGKSFVARAAAEYHLENGLPFALFDTDRSNPDVRRIYGPTTGCRVAVFSEGKRYEDTANVIFNTALEKRVLVNLAAQSFIPIRQWIEKNELLSLAEENDIQFVHWFVSDCGYDSLNLLGKTLEHFKTSMTHVLVKNFGMTDDWEPLDEDEKLQGMIADYGVKVIEFPGFVGNSDRNRIDKASLTFGQALEYDNFGVISRQRVKSFLRDAYAAFDEAGVF